MLSVGILLNLQCATSLGVGGMTGTTCSQLTWNVIKQARHFSQNVLRFFFYFQASYTAFFFSLPWTFGLALRNMGGICFKIDILMLNFYCHRFCSCTFQILHLFVCELWMYRKNVTIVAEHKAPSHFALGRWNKFGPGAPLIIELLDVPW